MVVIKGESMINVVFSKAGRVLWVISKILCSHVSKIQKETVEVEKNVQESV